MENNKRSSDTPAHRRSKKTKAIDGDAAIETLRTDGETRVIPQEIIDDILVRLPVKSLLRFRCVSKSWLSLISSPKFIKAHLENSTMDPNFSDYRLMLGILYDSVHNSMNHGSVSSAVCDLLTDAADGPIEHNEWGFRLNGSCNGLLCVSVFQRRLHFNVPEKHLFIWNPSTRMSKELPQVTAPGTKRIWTPAYGIGYDECNDDYKVAGLFWYLCKVDDFAKLMVNIYSLKNDSWKRIDDVKGGLVMSTVTSVIFLNGRFHFVLVFKHGNSSVRRITSLSLVDEVCGTVELPNDVDDHTSRLSIGIWEGCISALYSYSRDHADVWVLREYGVKDSWTKLARIPYVNVPHLIDNIFNYQLCILWNGKYLLGRGSQLVVYDPQDNSFAYPRKGNVHEICSTGIYVESLVPIPI